MLLFFYLWVSIQIIAEMLPISSSGHLQLLERWYATQFGYIMPETVFGVPLTTLYYFMHGPTLILLSIYFFCISPRPVFRWSFKKFTTVIAMLFIADCITALLYCMVHYFSLTAPLWFGFAISIAILFSLRTISFGNKEELTLHDACILGFVQGVALLPGISRLAATYTAGRWLGFTSLAAFEIAWLIQIPLIVAAFIKSLIFMAKYDALGHLLNLPFALVIVSASSIAWCALMAMVYIVKKNQVDLFAWYLFVPFLVSLFL